MAESRKDKRIPVNHSEVHYSTVIIILLIFVTYVEAACQENAEQICGNLCPKSCDSLNVMFSCVEGCEEGCFCKEGYVFESNESKRCVLKESCYSYCDVTKYETYYDHVFCGCSDRQDPNTCVTCTPGCHCIPGYNRNNGGSCVKQYTYDYAPPIKKWKLKSQQMNGAFQ